MCTNEGELVDYKIVYVSILCFSRPTSKGSLCISLALNRGECYVGVNASIDLLMVLIDIAVCAS